MIKVFFYLSRNDKYWFKLMQNDYFIYYCHYYFKVFILMLNPRSCNTIVVLEESLLYTWNPNLYYHFAHCHSGYYFNTINPVVFREIHFIFKLRVHQSSLWLVNTQSLLYYASCFLCNRVQFNLEDCFDTKKKRKRFFVRLVLA